VIEDARESTFAYIPGNLCNSRRNQEELSRLRRVYFAYKNIGTDSELCKLMDEDIVNKCKQLVILVSLGT
jgi:hypothetical protein